MDFLKRIFEKNRDWAEFTKFQEQDFFKKKALVIYSSLEIKRWDSSRKLF